MSTCWLDLRAAASRAAIVTIGVCALGWIAPGGARAGANGPATSHPSGRATATASYAATDREAWLLGALESAQGEVADAAGVRARIEAAQPKSPWPARIAAVAAFGRGAVLAATRPAILIPATFLAVMAGGVAAVVRMRRRSRGRRNASGTAARGRPAPVETRPSEHLPSFASAARRAAKSVGATRSERADARETGAEQSVWGRILTLSASGMPGDEIARALGASRDDVNLVLGLERKRVELAGALTNARAERGAVGASA